MKSVQPSCDKFFMTYFKGKREGTGYGLITALWIRYGFQQGRNKAVNKMTSDLPAVAMTKMGVRSRWE